MAKQIAHLDSSALLMASWDDETNDLDVTFRNGRTYTHPRVPESVFDGLRSASSAGQFYSQNIRGVYV
jgi:hypothetical protein